MSVVRIATRYAKSLIDLASEQGKLDPVYADMQYLQEVVKNRDVYLLLKSPIIHADKKVKIVEALFSSKVDVLTMLYLRLLINKRREMYLPEIALAFDQQFKTLRKITSVTVTTATPMSESLLDDLRKKLLASGVTSENLDIETKIDPDIIGGFILEFDNKRYDASVEQKLKELKSQFSKNLYIKEF